jgi:hypothetical protein
MCSGRPLGDGEVQRGGGQIGVEALERGAQAGHQHHFTPVIDWLVIRSMQVILAEKRENCGS